MGKARSFACSLPAILAMVVIPLGALPAFPQGYASTRSVQGTVSDTNGKPIAGAIVKLENTRTLQIRSCISEKDGGYAFHGLSGDVDYELTAQYHGRSGDTKTLSQFDSRTEVVIDLKVPAGG